MLDGLCFVVVFRRGVSCRQGIMQQAEALSVRPCVSGSAVSVVECFIAEGGGSSVPGGGQSRSRECYKYLAFIFTNSVTGLYHNNYVTLRTRCAQLPLSRFDCWHSLSLPSKRRMSPPSSARLVPCDIRATCRQPLVQQMLFKMKA